MTHRGRAAEDWRQGSKEPGPGSGLWKQVGRHSFGLSIALFRVARSLAALGRADSGRDVLS